MYTYLPILHILIMTEPGNTKSEKIWHVYNSVIYYTKKTLQKVKNIRSFSININIKPSS